MTNPPHPQPDTLPSLDDELLIGGHKLSLLRSRAGRTPFFAYDRKGICERTELVRRSLPERFHLYYAIKANPMPALVAHMCSIVDGFDVASGNELRLALDSGMTPSNISFAGPAKSIGEIRAAIAAGTCINCESFSEITQVRKTAEALAEPARVAIRVNPNFTLKSAGMQMGGIPTPFGIDASNAAEALRQVLASELSLEGIHIYTGSQSLDAAALSETLCSSIRLGLDLADSAGTELRTLNIGGGFGIPYFANEKPLALAQVGDALSTFLEHESRLSGSTKLILELGRYLVGECGFYVCEVVDIKQSHGETFIVVDGGMHHHLANSGNFGQVFRRNFPIVVGTRMTKPLSQIANINGPSCTPLDKLAEGIQLPAVAIGDLVVVLQSGAYGLTASPNGFLSQPAAVEILV